MRAAYEHHFRDAYEGTPRTHQIWNYWYVPGLYAYFHTAAYKVVPEPLLARFMQRLRQWSMSTLGLDEITPPYLSFYVNGCEQQLHNDVGNGRWAYVYSICEDPPSFEGGATILMPGNDYWDRRTSVAAAAGAGLYEKIAPKFDQLLVFDDRVLHGVETVHGGMNPRRGRVVLQGHIKEGGVQVDGDLTSQTVIDTLATLQPSLVGLVPQSGRFRGLATVRIQVAPAGEVVAGRLLVNQIYDPDRTGVASAILTTARRLRFPGAQGPTTITFPVRVGATTTQPGSKDNESINAERA
jgi:hypothetical protein